MLKRLERLLLNLEAPVFFDDAAPTILEAVILQLRPGTDMSPHRRVAFLPYVRTSLKPLIPKPYEFEPETIGEHILKRRLFLNMTQARVAELFDVSPSTVGNWENGHAEPKIFQMPILIKFLDYDPTNHNPNSIAEHLLFRRRALGWSQKEAARTLGIDPCTWSSWECGGTIMIHKHRRLVALFLGIAEEIINETMRKQWNERHGK